MELLVKARELFNTAHINKADCEALIAITQNANACVPSGYYAAAKMVFTKYLKNPFIILPQFNAAKEMLETLIAKHPDEIELRYLRYSIQVNTPKFVGYYKMKSTDRELIIKFLTSTSDEKLKAHILFYLENTKDLSEEEKKQIY